MSGSYVCSVSRGATSHGPKAWTNRSALQVVSGGTTYLARAEWELDATYVAHHAFVVSPLGLDGTLGASMTIPVESPDGIAAVAAAPQGQGFAVFWVDAHALNFASFDGQGALVGQPKVITALERGNDLSVLLHVAAGPSGSGFAVALSMLKDDALQPYALFLDANGAARGTLRRLGTRTSNADAYQNPAPEVIATRDGYAFAWTERVADSGRLFFTKTDAVGSETVAPKIVASTTGAKMHLNESGFGGGRTRLAETASGFILAWTEAYGGETDATGISSTGAWAVVRLAQLDAQGVATGPNATLRAPEDDVDEVEPVLTPFGDALAVAWGRGSHIYLCAGCVPDHRIDFVLVDPASLTPLSNVVTITNDGDRRGGGLLGKQVALTGSSFLTLYDRTFHTSADPGSAVFSCTK